MNSLSYLSRQFDHLASPRAPPSTPVSEYPPSIGDEDSADDEYALKRVKTWTKPFTDPRQPSHHSLSGPGQPHRPDGASYKRSFSSPTVAQHRTKAGASAGEGAPTHAVGRARRPSKPLPVIRSKTSADADGFLQRMFFVRVFVMVCESVHRMWARMNAWRGPPLRMDVAAAVEEGESDEKESESESDTPKDEPSSISLRLVPQRPVTAIPQHLRPTRSITDTSVLADVKSGSPPPSPQIAVAVTASARKTPFHQPKTLVLDLDETLVHSISRPFSFRGAARSGLFGFLGLGRKRAGSAHVVEVMLGGRRTVYHVYKRPFVDYFLRKVSSWYTLVIFTASMQEYADPVIDWLDAGRGILARRFFRESCMQHSSGSYMKDLSVIESDLSRVCLIDNSPICYSLNESNGIPIEGWTHDPSDQALLDLLPVLDSLRFTSDVRRVLGIRGFS